MVERKQGLGIIIAAIIVIAGAGVLLSPIGIFPPPVPFSWAIDEGDEFLYDIVALGINSTNNYLWPLVNTTIKVNITSLPDVAVFTEEGFRNLVYSDKVDCMFSNGSAIPYPLKTDIDDLVSRFFLPVGGWEFIDRLYSDSISEVVDNLGSASISAGLSRLYDDTLYFGFFATTAGHFDFGTGWSGNVSLSDGVPLFMERWGFSFSDLDFYTWVFHLEQTSGPPIPPILF